MPFTLDLEIMAAVMAAASLGAMFVRFPDTPDDAGFVFYAEVFA